MRGVCVCMHVCVCVFMYVGVVSMEEESMVASKTNAGDANERCVCMYVCMYVCVCVCKCV